MSVFGIYLAPGVICISKRSTVTVTFCFATEECLATLARPDLMKETDIKGTFHSTAKGGTSYLLQASASGGRAWPAA